ncbi:MAG: SRPBCC domain-containing protein [Gammaproteobacteria bacterium]|nr:SRPBCC domain-containing protein [Gammaproteobacteria bacterium]
MGVEMSLLSVRRSIFINASPERVWKEFDSQNRMAAWFGTGHTLDRFEPYLGGQVELSVEVGGERRAFGGPIVIWEEAREVTMENNWKGDGAWPVPMFFTLRLTPLYEGTHVELFLHGFERLGADAADNHQGYESAWDLRHLQALRAIVESSA